MPEVVWYFQGQHMVTEEWEKLLCGEGKKTTHTHTHTSKPWA